MIGLLLGTLAALQAGDRVDLKPAWPEAPTALAFLAQEGGDGGAEERWGLEPRRSPLKGYAIVAISGGTAFLLGAGITQIANNQCKVCTGKYTPLGLLIAGGVAWATGATLWSLAPEEPKAIPTL